MKTVIHKYQFNIGEKIVIKLQNLARPLKVNMQEDKITFWFLLYLDDKRDETYEYLVVGTGHVFDKDGYQYFDTFYQGPFVWHIFEKTEYSDIGYNLVDRSFLK